MSGRDQRRTILPVAITPAAASATMGDIVETPKDVWDTYRDTPVFRGMPCTTR